MICPHCGKAIQDNAAKLKQRRHRLGQCVDCAGPLTKQERADGHWRCLGCRVHATTLRRRREAVVGRARDRQAARSKPGAGLGEG